MGWWGRIPFFQFANPHQFFIILLVPINTTRQTNITIMSNSTMLEPDTGSANSKKNISVSVRTYNRLVALGKFSDRTLNGVLERILDERQKLETNLDERSF